MRLYNTVESPVFSRSVSRNYDCDCTFALGCWLLTQIFFQSRNPDGYFLASLVSCAHFQSRISLHIALKSRIPPFKWGKSWIPKWSRIFCNFILDNSNFPATRRNFCSPSDHLYSYIILPSITRTIFWALKNCWELKNNVLASETSNFEFPIDL